MDLRSKLVDPHATPFLYGTTPPREGSAPETIQTAAAKLAERVRHLPLDGFVVYDLQDESLRTDLQRPFPFVRAVDSRAYSQLLTRLSGVPAITYKCIGSLAADEWQRWLGETADTFAVGCLSLVGHPTSRGAPWPMTLSRAFQLAAAHPAGFTLGGVAIAERCGATPSEPTRMVEKTANGCRFFVTQAVYDPEATVLLLRDYARACRDRGLAPCRVVLTFTPCGREKTMSFMKWLGIAISAATERAILAAPSPLARSIEVCADNLRAVLAQPGFADVPIGVNVESVAITREEIEGSVALCAELAAVLAESPR
jgi:5,10-methylenetetrahydrofolate reductase